MTPAELVLIGVCLGILAELADEWLQSRRETERFLAGRWSWRRR